MPTLLLCPVFVGKSVYERERILQYTNMPDCSIIEYFFGKDTDIQNFSNVIRANINTKHLILSSQRLRINCVLQTCRKLSNVYRHVTLDAIYRMSSSNLYYISADVIIAFAWLLYSCMLCL